jgi:hypothetical protein
MSRTISINGTRLDQVRLPAEPYSKEFVSSLSYPKNQIRFAQDEGTVRLVIPPDLGLELYRIGILPQDAKTPVEISIGGRPMGRFLVSDVRYPTLSTGPFGEVTFTLTRVLEKKPRAGSARRPSRSLQAGSNTYVTDITHYLDESGELARSTPPARQLASFLTLLIEAATGAPLGEAHDSGIRCRASGCRGTVRTSLAGDQDEISWHCQDCGQNGVIRNWHNTKWNQFRRTKGCQEPYT